jgi:hypothetical protein
MCGEWARRRQARPALRLSAPFILDVENENPLVIIHRGSREEGGEGRWWAHRFRGQWAAAAVLPAEQFWWTSGN